MTFGEYNPDGEIVWELIVDTEGSLSRIMDRLMEAGCSVGVVRKTQIHRRSILTERQEELIRLAFENGYYDYPKGISLRKLSVMADVSFSTVNEILHRGERKIIRDYLFKKI